MSFKLNTWNLFIVLACVFVFGCKTSTESKSNVDIDWQGGSKLTYSYSSGVLAGGRWYNYFEVTNGSGDITFKVYVNGSKKKTKTFTVEEGLQYKITTNFSIGGCSGSSNSNVELKSSSVDNSKTLKVNCSNVTVSSVSVAEN